MSPLCRVGSRSTSSAGVAASLLLVAIGCSMPAHGAGDGVIFETDFRAAQGFRSGAVNGWNRNGAVPPPGWDAFRIGKEDSFIEVTDEGADGAALALNYRGPGRAAIALARHLTGSKDVGYEELYVRYNIKLPNNFKFGSDATGLPFWKWGRLWQNTTATPTTGNNWTENREDSGYVVWGVSPAWQYHQGFYSAWSDNTAPGDHTKGSNGSPMQGIKWYQNVDDASTVDGFFESVGTGAWALDPARPGFMVAADQTYHTIEWRFKLASAPGREDGEFQIWVDGVLLSPYTRLRAAFGAPTRSGIPTVSAGAGWNFFSLFDNLQTWAIDWDKEGVDGYLLIDDVVVSTQRIGHDYQPRGTTPLMSEVIGDSGGEKPPGECVVRP